MFDFDAGKLLVIGVVALIVIGPKDLPRVLRQLGQTVAKLRRMASEFQSQFMDAMREAELDDIRKDMAKLSDQAQIRSTFNPIQTVRRELTEAMAQRPAEPQGAPHLSLSGLDRAGEATESDFSAAAAAPIADAEPPDQIGEAPRETTATPARAPEPHAAMKAEAEAVESEAMEPSAPRRIGGI